MERKLLYRYLVWGAVAVVLVAGAVFLVRAHMKRETRYSGFASSTAQRADLLIGQQPAQPNAPLVPAGASLQSLQTSVSQQPLAPGCSLHFSFAPAAKAVAPGGRINYSAALTNLGKDTCQNTSFSIYYADNETFVSGSPQSSADNYYWVAGNLASRQTYQVTLSTEETASSPETHIQNEACATADNGSDVCADNLIFVQAGAPAMPVAGTGATANSLAQTAPAADAPAVRAPAPDTIWGAAFTSKQFGTWIWDSPIVMTPSYEKAAISAAVQNGFNTIYLTVEDYIPIARLPAGANKSTQQAAYFKALNNFITQAQANHIAVYVEGGANDWGEVANRWQGTALVDFVKEYNAAYPNAPITGLQLDVESYLDPAYATDPTDVLAGYLNLIADVTNDMKGTNAALSVVIPHFYDGVIQWTPEIPFGGTTNYPYNQLLSILQNKPGSSMVVMAYRNMLTGTNGTEALADTEVKEAQGTATRIIVAQETGDVQPSLVTFHGLTKENLYAALLGITNYFDSYSSFGGVAVHYLDPFLELKQ